MSNTSIILFGKPDSFESYELTNIGVKKIFDSFIEPEIKVSQNQNNIFHQFINEGYSYLQIYAFAQSFQSGREGIVIGVAFKSDKLIELSIDNFKRLKEVIDIFKNNTLDGNKFKSTSIEKNISEIYPEIATYITKINYKNNNISKPINQSLLLFLPDVENSLKNLRDEINVFKDVYISSNKDVFTSSINMKYLYNVQNKFYILNSENKIIEFEDIKHSEESVTQESPEISDEVKKLTNSVLDSSSKHDNLEIKFNKYKRAAGKKIKILSILSILFCLATFSFFFKSRFFPGKEPFENNQVSVGQNTESINNNQGKSAEQNSKISLLDFLDNPNKFDTLYNLCKNIKNYKTFKLKVYYDAIYRDGKALNINVNFIEKYKNQFDLEAKEKKEESKKIIPKKDSNK